MNGMGGARIDTLDERAFGKTCAHEDGVHMMAWV